jgi:hypothetical protein
MQTITTKILAYVLYAYDDTCHRFTATSDRQAKGIARRILGECHSTYRPTNHDSSLRVVQGWNETGRYDCACAALYREADSSDEKGIK